MDQRQTITRTKTFPTTIIHLLLLFQIGVVTSVTEDFYNPDYQEEIDQGKLINLGQDGIYNDSPVGNQQLETLEDEKFDKRHLGSVAALSGSKQRNEIPMSYQMLKRHLGSFHALSGVKQRPSSPQVLKRFLGSVKSGSRSPGSISVVGRSDTQWFDTEKRHMGAFAKTNSKPFNRIAKSDGMQFGASQENEDEQFYDYPTGTSDFPSGIETHDNINRESLHEPVTVKNKRFLGSLARVGWFPRQFRGIVAENPYEKRHIGSAARLGWLPISKSDRFGESGFGGEGGGFKRNIQSLKKVRFAVPSYWGREKRMLM